MFCFVEPNNLSGKSSVLPFLALICTYITPPLVSIFMFAKFCNFCSLNGALKQVLWIVFQPSHSIISSDWRPIRPSKWWSFPCPWWVWCCYACGQLLQKQNTSSTKTLNSHWALESRTSWPGWLYKKRLAKWCRSSAKLHLPISWRSTSLVKQIQNHWSTSKSEHLLFLFCFCGEWMLCNVQGVFWVVEGVSRPREHRLRHGWVLWMNSRRVLYPPVLGFPWFMGLMQFMATTMCTTQQFFLTMLVLELLGKWCASTSIHVLGFLWSKWGFRVEVTFNLFVCIGPLVLGSNGPDIQFPSVIDVQLPIF